MKFLVDAQLPYLLAQWIRDKGYEVVHTDDLPAKDETENQEIHHLLMLTDLLLSQKILIFWIVIF